MKFLGPWWIPALAALAVIPPLVLLYFLKLKRQRLAIASTLLWRKAVEDLRVNSPFQRLRSNLLLLLQLLIFAAAIVALAEPILSAGKTFDQAIVLLIDQSASMAAKEPSGQTRLEIARQAALNVVEGMTADQRALVIAFAHRARTVSPFSGDKKHLREVIESIEQTDAPGKLREAVALAEAHSTPQGEGIGIEQQVISSQMILFTDGRLADAEDVTVQRGTIEVVRVGETADNVAIVNLDVRRNYEQPAQIAVLARVRNMGTEPATRDVSLLVDGNLKAVQTIRDLAPAATKERIGSVKLSGIPEEGSEAVVPFDITLDTGAIVEVQLSGSDALATDDRAVAVVTPPHPMRVLLVTPGNRFLSQLLGVMPLDRLDTWTPQEYQDKPDSELIENSRCKYDVVVFDGLSTDRLPPGNYLFFGGVPLVDGVKAGAPREDGVFLDWDDTHPILQHVTVEEMHVVSWLDLTLPAQAITLIDGTAGPVLALLSQGRNQYLICAFGLFDATRTQLNTDWVYKPGIVAFLYDSLRFLAGSSTTGQQPPVIPGEAFSVPVARSRTKTVEVHRPDGTTDTAMVGGLGLASYGQTDHVGLYRVDCGIEGEGTRAVNLLSDQESFIAPNEDFRIASGQVASAGGEELSRRPLWPYLLMGALAVLFIEWLVYAKRVYV